MKEAGRLQMSHKTRLEQVLERYLNGREIAIWGNPTRSLLRVLKGYSYHIAENVCPGTQYVVAVSDEDLTDFEADEPSRVFEPFVDYAAFDPGGELPFEWSCHGVRIGRWTYFSDKVARACSYGHIESIGQFTSINESVNIAGNHQLDMIFLSDDMHDFFTPENEALFKEKLRTSPNHPHTRVRPRVTIGNDVYIGANAFINSSRVSSIGDGVIIGSGAIVLEDVPPYAVVVGVTAKIIRYRFEPDMIEVLLRVKWWDWSIEEINAQAEALMTPSLFMERFARNYLILQ